MTTTPTMPTSRLKSRSHPLGTASSVAKVAERLGGIRLATRLNVTQSITMPPSRTKKRLPKWLRSQPTRRSGTTKTGTNSPVAPARSCEECDKPRINQYISTRDGSQEVFYIEAMGNGHSPLEQGCHSWIDSEKGSVEIVENGSSSHSKASREDFNLVITTGLRSKLPIGLTFSTEEDAMTLVIADIASPSLITEWNRIHDASEAVHTGDAVTCVNGLSGNGRELQEQLLLFSRSFEKEEVVLEIRPSHLLHFNKRGRSRDIHAANPGAEDLWIDSFNFRSQADGLLQTKYLPGADMPATLVEPTPSHASTSAPSLVTAATSVATPLSADSTSLPLRTQHLPQPKRRAASKLLS